MLSQRGAPTATRLEASKIEAPIASNSRGTSECAVRLVVAELMSDMEGFLSSYSTSGT